MLRVLKVRACFPSTSSSFIPKDQGKVDSSRRDPSKIITVMIMKCVLFFYCGSLSFTLHISATSPSVSSFLLLRSLSQGITRWWVYCWRGGQIPCWGPRTVTLWHHRCMRTWTASVTLLHMAIGNTSHRHTNTLNPHELWISSVITTNTQLHYHIMISYLANMTLHIYRISLSNHPHSV